MKRSFFLFPLLFGLLACNFNITTMPPDSPTQTDSNMSTMTAPGILTTTSEQITSSRSAEEAQIRKLVENFGKRLQIVSLLAPDAAETIQKEYSEFTSPTLLEIWMTDVSNAPGRMVSSPWPDRIEISTLTRESPDRYVITGFIVEVTSTEISSDEAATKKPVHLIVQRAQGHWQITDYAEEQ